MTNDVRQRAARRRYIALLALVCCVLLIAVVVILRRLQDSPDAPPDTIPETTETTELPVSVIPSSETPTVPHTETTETATETEEETLPAAPDLTSENGLLHSNKAHLYVRVGNEQKVLLTLGAGARRSEIDWSVSDPAVADVTDGVLTGLQKGECTLCAKIGSDTLEIPVTVRELYVEDGCTYVDGILVANKSYSLPQSYDPGMLPVTEEAFEKLSEAAADEGLDIYEGSGYRDYDFQVTVYNSIVNGYSKEYADEVSARPGHSEHQTGYTVDCNTIDDAFGETAEGKWLAAHCHEFGFIIRYPKGKEDITGYAYEAWHIRYVGLEAAAEIFDQGLTLEEYLDIDSRYPEDASEEENENEAE